MKHLTGIALAASLLALSACNDDSSRPPTAAPGAEAGQARSFSALVDEAFKRSPDDAPLAVNGVDIQFADNQSFDEYLQN